MAGSSTSIYCGQSSITLHLLKPVEGGPARFRKARLASPFERQMRKSNGISADTPPERKPQTRPLPSPLLSSRVTAILFVLFVWMGGNWFNLVARTATDLVDVAASVITLYVRMPRLKFSCVRKLSGIMCTLLFFLRALMRIHLSFSETV